jgi:hypothetical protein
MAKSRYSKSKKVKSRRGKKSRCIRRTKRTKRTKRHTRRRAHHGGYTPGPPTIPVPLGSEQLLSGLKYHRGGGYHGCQDGGVEQSTGGYIAINGPVIRSLNPVCGVN